MTARTIRTARTMMTSRRIKAASIFAGLVLAALALLGWSQPWFIVTLSGSLTGQAALEVGGDVGGPAVAALALASAAGFAAIAISGPFFRGFLAVLQVFLGASVVLSAVVALMDPFQVVSGAVTEVSGLAGSDAITPLIGANVPTVWPFVTLVVGALLAVLGLAILFTGRMWPRAGRRYERGGIDTEGGVDTEGSDETERGVETAGGVESSSGDTAVSRWDELSGGSDPTSR